MGCTLVVVYCTCHLHRTIRIVHPNSASLIRRQLGVCKLEKPLRVNGNTAARGIVRICGRADARYVPMNS
jgi:hypothetical protein